MAFLSIPYGNKKQLDQDSCQKTAVFSCFPLFATRRRALQSRYQNLVNNSVQKAAVSFRYWNRAFWGPETPESCPSQDPWLQGAEPYKSWQNCHRPQPVTLHTRKVEISKHGCPLPHDPQNGHVQHDQHFSVHARDMVPGMCTESGPGGPPTKTVPPLFDPFVRILEAEILILFH